MMSRLFIIALATLFPVVAGAQTFPKGTCLALDNVDEWDFLYIRARPDHKSDAVGAIRYATENPLVVSGECTPNTRNVKRMWCPVTYYLNSDVKVDGYVKMYFTRPIECPPAYGFYR